MQEEVGVGQDGSEETVKLLPRNSSFGEISILCNIPQPYTVRVCELCRLLRIDKQSLSNILEIYFYDGRKILDNLLEVIKLCQHALPQTRIHVIFFPPHQIIYIANHKILDIYCFLISLGKFIRNLGTKNPATEEKENLQQT